MPITTPSATAIAPFDLAALASWTALFEASRITSLADGAPVSTWPDAGPSARHATQSGAARPIYKSGANGINGQPVVRFTAASSQFMTTASGGAALASDYYMAALVRFTTNTGLQTILAAGDEATGKRRVLLKYDAGQSNRVGFNGFAADITPGGLAPSAGVPCLLEVIRAGTAISVYMNGVRTSRGTPSLNAFTSAVLTLGANNAGGENLNGDLAFAAFLPAAPDAVLLQKVRGYARTVYGVSAVELGAANFLAQHSAAGLPTRSSFFDNGADAGLIGRRLVAFTTAGEHLFYVENPIHGALLTQNFNAAGYSDLNMQGEDVGTWSGSSLVLPYGFAVGWGNSAAVPQVFRNAGYCESYDSSLSGSFRAFRIVQTNAGDNFRRLDIEAATGDIVFYRRNAAFPSETEILRLKSSGAIIASNLPTSDPSTAGQLWNSTGTLKVSAG